MDHPIKSGDDGIGDYRNLILSAVITTPSPFVIAVRDTAIHETKA